MLKPIVIMFIAMSMIPAGDLSGKLMTEGMGVHPSFVALSRFVLGALIVAPLAPHGTWALLADWRVWLRACSIAFGVLAIQTALRTEALADVFAAFFVGPIISFALSALFLREPAGWLRSLLMLAGFCGVLLVVRPGVGGSPGLIWALVAGSCYGTFLTTSRWLSHIGSPLQLTATQLVASAVIVAPFSLPHLPAFTWPIAGLSLSSAAFSMGGNLLLLYVYARAESTKMAPLVYFQLIAATGLGWLVFNELPDLYTITGLFVILAAGLTSASLRR
ncbi:DMT family transporter [Arenibacterium halophilum]|uniref:DMT family transporter n=1 Tax=Arenibacterium halophilum TaxID=2583821 RepID=A0ABY2X7X7_9RHOB|nr:DMT family transporter [Arenibacterium halophilum]TMV11904.1 DMT family transporter [Arenibacterium halophilum]